MFSEMVLHNYQTRLQLVTVQSQVQCRMASCDTQRAHSRLTSESSQPPPPRGPPPPAAAPGGGGAGGEDSEVSLLCAR
jgi:hypothetical protein